MKSKNNQQALCDQNTIVDKSGNPVTIHQLYAAVNEMYSNEIGRHTMRAMLENARGGFFNGGIAPYGYNTVSVWASYGRLKKRIVPSVSEAAVVSMAFSFFVGGNGNGRLTSVVDLTAWLNDQGKRNRKGNLWSVQAIRKLLRNPIYRGHYRWNVSGKSGSRVTTSVPSIVTAQAFYAAQKLLQSQKRK